MYLTQNATVTNQTSIFYIRFLHETDLYILKVIQKQNRRTNKEEHRKQLERRDYILLYKATSSGVGN